MLKYTPDQVRAMTVGEFNLAIDGYMEAQGVNKKKLMSRNDLLTLMGK